MNKKLCLNFTLALAFFFGLSFKAFSNSECESYLISESSEQLTFQGVEFPGRGHRFTIAELETLPEDQQDLVEVLLEGSKVFDLAEVVEAIRAINQPLSFFVKDPSQTQIPDLLLKIIKNSTYEKTVIQNYILFEHFLGTEFSKKAKMGLSLLFAGIKRSKKSITTDDYNSHSYQNQKKLFFHIEDILNTTQVATTLLLFLENPLVSVKAKLILNDLAEELKTSIREHLEQLVKNDPTAIRTYDLEGTLISSLKGVDKNTALDVQAFRREYLKKKKFSHQQAFSLFKILDDLSLQIEVSFEAETKLFPDFLKMTIGVPLTSAKLKDYPWSVRLRYIENYLVETFDFRENINQLVFFMDHIRYGSAMPVKTEDLESIILESLKTWLIPVKTSIQKQRLAIQQSQRSQNPNHVKNLFATTPSSKHPAQPNASTNDVEDILGSELGYAPKMQAQSANPNKRRNQVGYKNSTDENLNDGSVPRLSDESRKPIPDDKNFYLFSVFADQPKPTSDLSFDKTYQLYFMREGADSKVYTLQMDDEVIKGLVDIPDVAIRLIRGFNLGFARSQDEDGLKILRLNRPGVVGRYYELKAMGYDHRIIVHHFNGHWRWLKLTTKSKLNRSLNDYL